MRRDYYATDLAVTFFLFMIGASEATHLYGAFLRKPFSMCSLLFAVIAGAVCLFLAFFLYLYQRRKRQTVGKSPIAPLKATELVMAVLLLLLFLSQAVYIVLGKGVCRQGDITIETVGSFLQSGSVYELNPLTGRPYTAGMPFRWKIVGLPTLYAILCHTFSVEPVVLVRSVIPVAVLLFSYAAYFCLAGSLFPDNRSKRLVFLLVMALLVWVGDYGMGMEGYHLLHGGWQGTTIRNAVLVPYTVSLCLRRKYLHGVLCCLAEACLVWTGFGLGACAFVLTGLLLAGPVVSGFAGDEGRTGGGKEELQ